MNLAFFRIFWPFLIFRHLKSLFMMRFCAVVHCKWQHKKNKFHRKAWRMFFWNHIFVSQWNYTELVSNERGDQKDSISGLFWGKKYDKDRLLYILTSLIRKKDNKSVWSLDKPNSISYMYTTTRFFYFRAKTT